MTKSTLIIALVTAITVSLPSQASDMVGIYGKVEQVVKLRKPSRVQIWGTFYTSGPNGSYVGPKTGYLLFNVDLDDAKVVNEVNDLIGLAGTGKCAGFAQRNYRGADKLGPDFKVVEKGAVEPKPTDFPIAGGITVLPKNAQQCGGKQDAEDEAADAKNDIKKNPGH